MASAQIVGKAELRGPTLPGSHLGSATQLLDGALLLPEDNKAMFARCFLCGQVIECLLKAYLTAMKTEPGYTHDLLALWSEAERAGLALPSPAPTWLKPLHDLHAHPFVLRYPEGKNGFSIPVSEPMLTDLVGIQALVTPTVRAFR